jgi:beta-glucosidase
LYNFGYGLSYTTFKYGNVKLSSGSIKIGDSVNVSVSVSNTGGVDGDEVVQIYVQYPNFPEEPHLSLKV